MCMPKSKGQMRLSERIAASLPGFRGYKEKELRRETDKLIRNNLTSSSPKIRITSEAFPRK